MIAVFDNPGLLGALALAAIPVLIHLFARKRHRRVPWAAMQLIALARRRLRQRVELRDWILLAVRIGIVAAIVLAAARPRAPHGGVLGLIAPGEREVVMVFDTSASMDTRASDSNRLRRAVLNAEELLQSLGPADRVTLVTYDRRLRFEVREQPPAGHVRDRLERIVTSSRADDPRQAVAALTEDVTRRPGAKDVFLFSDFPRRGWEELSGTRLPGTTRSGDPIRWTLVPLTESDAGNLAITGIEAEPLAPGRDVPACIRIKVWNPTDRSVDGRKLSIRVDGGGPILRTLRVPARGTVEVTVPHRFANVGQARVEASLDPDALPADDRRAAVVDVVSRPRITLVAPLDDRTRGRPCPADFLIAALQACLEEGQWAFDLDRITPETLAATGADSAGVVIVPDLSSVTSALAGRLKRVVAEGGSLLFAAGPRIDTGGYNAKLHEESGVLPFRLESHAVPHDPPARLRLAPHGRGHRALSFLTEIRPDHLGRAAIHRTLAPSRLPPLAHVLLHAGESDRVPLLVEVPVERGRVIWFSTTLGPEWSDLPIPAAGNHLFVPMMLELIRYAAQPDSIATPPTTAGDPLRFSLPPGAAPPLPRVLGPDGLPAGPVTLKPVAPGGRPEIEVREADLLGVYRLSGPRKNSEPGHLSTGDRLAAVVLDPTESRPGCLEPARLAGLFPDSDVSISTGAERFVRPPARGGSIVRWFLALAAGLMLLESALAAHFGRGRS